jgi:hypothetical protein
MAIKRFINTLSPASTVRARQKYLFYCQTARATIASSPSRY